MAGDKSKRSVIITGVREIDEKLGGGIPVGSLGLIEGQPDSGKSVLSQHLTYGALTAANIPSEGSSHTKTPFPFAKPAALTTTASSRLAI